MRGCQGGVALSSVLSYKSFEYVTRGLTQPARSDVLHGFLDRQRSDRFALSLADTPDVKDVTSPSDGPGVSTA